jgi:hypothetical protein
MFSPTLHSDGPAEKFLRYTVFSHSPTPPLDCPCQNTAPFLPEDVSTDASSDKDLNFLKPFPRAHAPPPSSQDLPPCAILSQVQCPVSHPTKPVRTSVDLPWEQRHALWGGYHPLTVTITHISLILRIYRLSTTTDIIPWSRRTVIVDRFDWLYNNLPCCVDVIRLQGRIFWPSKKGRILSLTTETVLISGLKMWHNNWECFENFTANFHCDSQDLYSLAQPHLSSSCSV